MCHRRRRRFPNLNPIYSIRPIIVHEFICIGTQPIIYGVFKDNWLSKIWELMSHFSVLNTKDIPNMCLILSYLSDKNSLEPRLLTSSVESVLQASHTNWPDKKIKVHTLIAINVRYHIPNVMTLLSLVYQWSQISNEDFYIH